MFGDKKKRREKRKIRGILGGWTRTGDFIAERKDTWIGNRLGCRRYDFSVLVRK